MVTWVAIEPLSVTVEAGGEADVSLRIRNTSDIVEEYHVDVVGDPALWCTAEPATLRLYPGTTGTVRLTFAPPKGPDPAAGPHPYGVRVRPVEAPDAVTVAEGNVSVAPFTDIRAELLPVIVRGWSRAKPRLVVDNYGNTLATVSMKAEVQDNSVDFDTRTPGFQVPPGRAHFGLFTGRPNRLLWSGQKVRHPFTATVIPSGSAGTTVSGTYLQTVLFPSWLTRLFAALVALAIAFVALWLLASPKVQSQATAKPLALGASPAANASSAPAASAPSAGHSQQAQVTQTQQAAAPQAPPAGGGGGGGGAQPGPAAVTLPQPLGWWQLNQGNNTHVTTAPDSSGNNHTLNASDVMWCNGGGCVWFDGSPSTGLDTSGQVLDTGTGSSYTVSARVFLDHAPGSGKFATAVSQDGATSGTNTLSGFYLQYTPDGCWSFSLGAGKAESCGAATNTWVFLTGVYNGSTNSAELYVNGAPVKSLPNASPFASNGPLAIGRAQWVGQAADQWAGSIDNVEVFGQALNQQQVQKLYQQNNH